MSPFLQFFFFPLFLLFPLSSSQPNHPHNQLSDPHYYYLAINFYNNKDWYREGWRNSQAVRWTRPSSSTMGPTLMSSLAPMTPITSRNTFLILGTSLSLFLFSFILFSSFFFMFLFFFLLCFLLCFVLFVDCWLLLQWWDYWSVFTSRGKTRQDPPARGRREQFQ